MKKKLFLLLLIVALAAFVFTGCTPPAEGEGEGEGEGEVTEPTIEIDGGYVKGQYTFVQKGKAYDVTVTFPAPASNVELSFECEVNDLTKAIDVEGLVGLLEPVEGTNKTVWTGKFTFKGCDTSGGILSGDKIYTCSLGYLYAEWGECDVDCYARIPVIVDGDKPYAQIGITSKACCCGECEVVFKSTKAEDEDPCSSCEPTGACCDDDCSGLAHWKIDLYKMKSSGTDLFDECCELSCVDLVDSGEGEGCPIEWTTTCLEQDVCYYAAVTLEDFVGNKRTYYAALKPEYTAATDDNPAKCTIKVYKICCDNGVTYINSSSVVSLGSCKDEDPCPTRYSSQWSEWDDSCGNECYPNGS